MLGRMQRVSGTEGSDNGRHGKILLYDRLSRAELEITATIHSSLSGNLSVVEARLGLVGCWREWKGGVLRVRRG